MIKRYVHIAFFLFTLAQMQAQTCCTAGAPISSNLQISNSDVKSLSIQLNYEYKSINLLIDNNERLDNDPRSRLGQNVALKLDYILTDRWAVSTILPVIYQSRSTVSESQSSIGIGDLSMIGQYSILVDQRNAFNVAAGIKLPTGKVSHRDASSIFLSPDMQSGSGSFDFILRTSFNRTRFILPFLTANLSIVYRKNGLNDSFGSTDNFEGRSFAFGDHAIAIFGLQYLIDFKNGFLIPDLAIKYRWSAANKEQETTAPNSGGNWLSIPFGFSYDIDGVKSIRLYSELPIYQKLDGLQITTDFLVGIQLTYLLKKQHTDNIIEL